MIDGVRMRLPVTVWNSTLDQAIATPTTAIVAILRDRIASANSQFPAMPAKAKAATAPRASSASTAIVRRSRRRAAANASPVERAAEIGRASCREGGEVSGG